MIIITAVINHYSESMIKIGENIKIILICCCYFQIQTKSIAQEVSFEV